MECIYLLEKKNDTIYHGCIGGKYCFPCLFSGTCPYNKNFNWCYTRLHPELKQLVDELIKLRKIIMSTINNTTQIATTKH